MTAQEARELVKASGRADPAKVKAILDLWHRAIEDAARAGKAFVRRSSLPTIRTPLAERDWSAASNHLMADGFTVKEVQGGPSEYTTEVRWLD